MKYADFWARFGAHILDNLINVGVMILGIIMIAGGFSSGNGIVGGFALMFAILGYFGFLFYNHIYLVGEKGASLGKKAVGLQIVNEKGKNIGMGMAFVRILVKDLCFLFSLMGAILYIVPLLAGDKKQSLGDLAASSYVIYKK